MGVKHFGARVTRFEDPALLSGRGRFVDDISLPGALNACFVRSPHAHAKIRGIDGSAALAMPGVHAVYTAADMPEPMRSQRIPMMLPVTNPATMRTQHCLALDEVNYAGQAIAVVIADSRPLAEDAAAMVAVDFDVLPAASDAREAAASGAPQSHTDIADNIALVVPTTYGDVEGAFAKAAHVFEEAIWAHRGGGMAMEPRAVLASYEGATDMLTVWSGTQTPHLGRRTLADMLQRDLEAIRFIAPDVGGGFGPKAPFYAEEAIIPVASMKLGRPVKWFEDRREHFLCAIQERDQYWKVAVAVDKDGKLLAFRGSMLHDTGAFTPWGIVMPYIAAVTVPGPYVMPAYKLEVTVVLTNKVPTAPVRGAGRPQAVFVMERLMDRIARELNLDRVEVRRRNMIRPEQMPYEIPMIFRDGKPIVYHGGDFPKSQDVAVEQSKYDTFHERQAKALAQGRYIGIGIANYVEGTGLGPFEGVTVRVLTNGKVAVATGATNQGQGTRTTLSQIVADQVGCKIEDIVMTVADTGAISQGVGGFASRQAVNAGSSALIAGTTVRKQIVALAARALGVAETDIDLEESEAIARTGNKPKLTFAELARMAQGVPGSAFPEGQPAGLEHTAYFTTPQASYCNGTHVVEVEVDPMTGGVGILDYTVGHDSGVVINPMIVDGQVQGGVAHGIGNALFEHMKYDADANPLTTTFQDYLMPGSTDVPSCKIIHVETPNPLNPIGVKGAGEGGTIPAPAAIVAAIENALSPFGVHFVEMPLTPEKIVTALQDAGAYDKLSAA